MDSVLEWFYFLQVTDIGSCSRKYVVNARHFVEAYLPEKNLLNTQSPSFLSLYFLEEVREILVLRKRT